MKRIVVHDYAGHPFQVQLSRELARRGHEVHHLYFKDDLTPRGALQRKPTDPPSLVIEGVGIEGSFKKYTYWGRYRAQLRYGRKIARHIEKIAPDILICANTPVDTLAEIRRSCLEDGREFIVWLQDILSVGTKSLLSRRIPLIGALIGERYIRVERRNLRAADKVVCITEDFLPLLASWGIERRRCEVIENWSPLDEIAPFQGTPSWAIEQGLAGKRLVLYSGTLGLKHNPRLLSQAARAIKGKPGFEDVVLVVVTEGPGTAFLDRDKRAYGLDNLVVLPWQPYQRLAEMLSSADLLLAVLEAEAGVFAVPSKVLSYLCAGRPVLLAAPEQNLASRTLLRAGAGRVVPPEDGNAFSMALQGMLSDPASPGLGRQGRAYAERVFAIETIADRFEALWRGPDTLPLRVPAGQRLQGARGTTRSQVIDGAFERQVGESLHGS